MLLKALWGILKIKRPASLSEAGLYNYLCVSACGKGERRAGEKEIF